MFPGLLGGVELPAAVLSRFEKVFDQHSDELRCMDKDMTFYSLILECPRWVVFRQSGEVHIGSRQIKRCNEKPLHEFSMINYYVSWLSQASLRVYSLKKPIFFAQKANPVSCCRLWVVVLNWRVSC